MDEKHDLSNYQVVRQDYVPGFDEPQLTFNNGKIYINSYGLSLFPEDDYVRILVDDKTKSIVIEPGNRKRKDSFKWAGGSKKRRPRHKQCRPLYYLIYRMMSWDVDIRYRITGTLEDHGEKQVLYFDLSDANAFKRTGQKDENGREIIRQCFPSDWLESYGLPLMNHDTRNDIQTFDDVAIFQVELEADRMAKERMERLRVQEPTESATPVSSAEPTIKDKSEVTEHGAG